MATRPLIAATIPLQGPMDSTQPMVMVAQQANGIYILCLVRYSGPTGNILFELIFSPYFSGDYISSDGSEGIDNTVNLLRGISYSNGSYSDISLINAVNYPQSTSDYGTILQTSVAMLKYNSDSSFTVLGDNGNNLGFLQTVNSTEGATWRYQATFVGTSSTPYIIQPQNLYFSYPNIYAGENYSITYSGIVPFRFFTGVNQVAGSFLMTPSFCGSSGSATVPPKSFDYQCNSYSAVSPFNLLRFIDYFSNTKNNIKSIVGYASTDVVKSAQSDQTLINFYPYNFYQGNASFAAGMIQTGPTFCSPVANGVDISNYDPSFFMKYSYYFWASGFVSYSNNGVTQTPINTQGAPGFIGKGQSSPVNITGWITEDDCNRSYFYTYCQPNTSAAFCGTCLGACSSGQNCSGNPLYVPPNPPEGQNPFVCGQPPPPPPPDQAKTFWDKYKTEIIIGIIVTVAVGIFFLIFILVINKNKSSSSEEDYDDD